MTHSHRSIPTFPFAGPANMRDGQGLFSALAGKVGDGTRRGAAGAGDDLSRGAQASPALALGSNWDSTEQSGSAESKPVLRIFKTSPEGVALNGPCQGGSQTRPGIHPRFSAVNLKEASCSPFC